MAATTCFTLTLVKPGVYEFAAGADLGWDTSKAGWVRVLACEEESCSCSLTDDDAFVVAVDAASGRRYNVKAESFSKLQRRGEEFLLTTRLCGDCMIPMVLKKNATTGARFYACPSYEFQLRGEQRACQYPTVSTVMPPTDGLVQASSANADTWSWMAERKAKSVAQVPKWAKQQLSLPGLDLDLIGTELKGQQFNCAFGRQTSKAV